MRGDRAATVQATGRNAVTITGSASGTIKTLFWSAQVSANWSDSDTRTNGYGTLCATGLGHCLINRLISTNTSVNAGMQLNGTAWTLPGGPATFNVSLERISTELNHRGIPKGAAF